MAMVRVNRELMINAAYVSHVKWDRRQYINAPGDSMLVITMADGAVHRVRHEPWLMGGTDCYAVEREIDSALAQAGL
ncbi:hypothetical protein [Flavisphingomonas formosensis]|uniref:hypothetical protein n=1 Tax=Flavisphingomonas formosensis TaxID=861534 RepID=UPI0012F9D14D|nr:hypothetical protein [Sphingomonas formosensis]